jgi:hypothetical protein
MDTCTGDGVCATTRKPTSAGRAASDANKSARSKKCGNPRESLRVWRGVWPDLLRRLSFLGRIAVMKRVLDARERFLRGDLATPDIPQPRSAPPRTVLRGHERPALLNARPQFAGGCGALVE